MNTPKCPGCGVELEHVLLDEFDYFYCVCADDGCDRCQPVAYDYDGNVIFRLEDLVDDKPTLADIDHPGHPYEYTD